MYFILCANFDAVILTYCEQIGFILRSSRKYKFYLLFLCMGLFIIGVVVLEANMDSWADQQLWIINATAND